MANLDQELFNKWQAADLVARNQAWELLCERFYSVAFRYCRGFVKDYTTAETQAADAFNQTFLEVDEKVVLGEMEWRGEEHFIAYVGKRLIWRCKDKMGGFWEDSERTVSGDSPAAGREEEELALFDLLADESPSPDRTLSLLTRDLFRLLAATAQACREEEALVEILEGMAEYLRECLIKTMPSQSQAVQMTIDELLAAAAFERVEVTQTELYEFIEPALGINRNTLYLRMRRLRSLFKQLRQPSGVNRDALK